MGQVGGQYLEVEGGGTGLKRDQNTLHPHMKVSEELLNVIVMDGFSTVSFGHTHFPPHPTVCLPVSAQQFTHLLSCLFYCWWRGWPTWTYLVLPS